MPHAGSRRRNLVVRLTILAFAVLLLFLAGDAPPAAAQPTVIATIPVEYPPSGVEVNPTTNRIYVAQHGTNNISVIDGATNSVVTTVPVGDQPIAVGVNPTTNLIYVANHGSGDSDVSVIDGGTNSVVATVPVGDRPRGVGVNPTTNRIYVSNYGSGDVSVIDGATNSVVATVAVGFGPIGVGVNPTTNLIYVANSGSFNVSVIDGTTNSVVATVGIPVACFPYLGPYPHGVGVNPTTNRIYVANEACQSVSVIDGASNTFVTTVAVGIWPYGVGVNPTTNRIYVANNGTHNVSVIDGATDSVVATVGVGTWPHGVGVNPASNRIYVTNHGSSTVSVIEDIPTPTPPAAWPMFQHDAQRSGRSPYIGPQEPNGKWEFIPDNPEEAFDSPAIGADGTVYVGTIYSGLSPSGLYAITQEGQVAWLHESAVIPRSPALGPDGTVYVLTQGPNELVALNPNGTVKWRIEGASWAIYDPVEPAVGDDATLYHVTDCILPGGESHPSLVAFDPDGFVRWFHDLTEGQRYPGADCSFPAGGSSYHSHAPFSSPALGEDGAIYFVNDDRVFALDADGAEKWTMALERPCDPGNCFVSISPNGTIYAAVSGRSWPSPPAHLDWADLYALSPEGSVIWRLPQEASDLGWWTAPAVGVDGTLYLVRWHYGFSSAVLTLRAYAPDGTLRWSDVVSYGSAGAPVVGGDGTIYTWGQGTLRAYAPDGTLSWTAYASGPPGGVGLAIGPDETLYVAANKLYAFGPEPPAPESTNGGPAANPYVPHSEEPVNLATGNYALRHSDVNIPGKGLPLSFARSYNSLDATAGRLGVGWTDNYNVRLVFAGDPATSDVTVIREVGRQDEYLRLDDGSYQPPRGIFDTLVHNGDGTFALTRKNKSVLQFDSDGVLQSLEDRNGNLTTLSYDGSGNLTTVTDPSGRTLTFVYDTSDRITSVADPLTHVTTYAYDANGDLVSVTDPEDQTTSYTYDVDHQMLTITDPRGNTIMTNVYDGQGRVTSQTNADGETWTFSYGDRVTMETDPRGCATLHAYDFRYRETQRTDCLGGVTTYTYDAFGNRDSITNPLDRTTTMTYDSRGNLLSITNALGNTTTFTYDDEDNLLSKTDRIGRVTTYTYDANGNLLTSTDALDGVTTFTYDGEGQLLTATDPLSNASTFTYGVNGYLATGTDPLDNTTTFTYDDGGRLLTQTDPLDHVTTFTYDDVDRLLTVTDPLTHVTTYTYDTNGNKTSVTDANLKTTSYTYDALNRLETVTDAAEGVVTYTYDSVGNRTSMTDANSHTTSYAYDLLNRLSSVTDPEGNVTAYTCDAVGNRLTRTDANGATTDYSYDPLNRLTSITYPDQPSVSYTYDALGNRLSMTDLTGTTTYAYDELYRLTSVTNPGGATISYTYDAAGNRTSLTYPDDKTASYDYDDASRLVTVTDWAARLTSYDYDDASRLTDTDLPNGIHTGRTYDDANRLLSIGHNKAASNLITVSYTLDDVGNRLARAETVGAGSPETDTYGYDDIYRLTSVDYGGAYDDQTYSYDPMDNRTQLVEGATTTDYTYDDADRLLTVGSTTFDFDANGNQVREGNRTFTYDRENRLIQVGDWTSAPDDTCADTNWDGAVNSGDLLAIANAFGTRAGSDDYEPVKDPRQDGAINAGDLLFIAGKLMQECQLVTASVYNGAGLRTYQSQVGATQRYVWDAGAGLPVILQEMSGTSYEYGLELILEESASTPMWYLQDGLSFTVALAEGSGAITDTYAYDVYGSSRSASPAFSYTGEQPDDSGLLYLRARLYDPSTGRFLVKDLFPGLAHVPHSLNRYAYVSDNPVAFIDPEGLSAKDWLKKVPGLGFGIAAHDAAHAPYVEETKRCIDKMTDPQTSSSEYAACEQQVANFNKNLVRTGGDLVKTGAAVPGTSVSGPPPTSKEGIVLFPFKVLLKEGVEEISDRLDRLLKRKPADHPAPSGQGSAPPYTMPSLQPRLDAPSAK